jgi:hypothetical protein
VEASLSPHELVRPWRRATLVASLLAAVELVLLIVAGAIIVAGPLSRSVHHHAEKVAAATPRVAPKHAGVRSHAQAAARQPVAHPATHPALTRTRVRVLVLNGNGRTGVAHTEASRLQGLGYRIAGTENARRHDYATSVVMYRPGYRTEGVRLAHDLHIRVVGPLDGLSARALQGGQLAVILGAA